MQSGHCTVKFSTCFNIYKTAQNIIYSSCRGTKCPWLCLVTTLLLFGLLWLFSLLLHVLTSMIKLVLWLKFSTDKWQAEDTGEKDHRVLLCPSSTCKPCSFLSPGSKPLHVRRSESGGEEWWGEGSAWGWQGETARMGGREERKPSTAPKRRT